ncbi:MAG: sugar ABC transporter permease [bacterium]|nr:sugar ABC transporter permease [bacterium]
MKNESAVMKRREQWHSVKRYRGYYLLLIPGFLYLIVFKYLPFAGLVIAFNDYTPFQGFWGIFTSPWVGLDHFVHFFTGPYFKSVLFNTLYISISKLVIGFPTVLIFALLLNEIKLVPVKRFIQSLSYLPHFVSWVVVVGLMQMLLSTNFGLVNGIIKSLGHEPVLFMGTEKWFIPLVILSSIWKNTGWESIIILAAIAGIAPQLYESAMIDGASRLQMIWHITLPSIKFIIGILLILRIGRLINTDFEQMLLMLSPPVYQVGEVIDTYVYREGIQELNYSYAAAVGIFKSVIAFILISIANKTAKTLNYQGLY